MNIRIIVFLTLLLAIPAQAQFGKSIAFRASSTKVASGGGGGGTACDSAYTANVKLYARLDETSGTRADTSGNGNDLGDSGSTGSTTGIIGNAALFSTSTYLSAPDNASLRTGATDWSAGFWFNVSNPSTGQFQAIAGKFSEWVVNLTDTGSLQFLVNSGSGPNPTLTYSGTISANTWYYVVVTCHPAGGGVSTRNLYVNAVAETPVSSADITSGTDDFTIGAVLGVWKLGGKVDEVMFTKAILTPTEISNLFNSNAGCRPTGP